MNKSHILCVDVETSGIAFNGRTPVYDESSKEQYAVIQLAAVLLHKTSLREVSSFSRFIRFNSKIFNWSISAQNVHGKSIPFLDKNGVEEKEAAYEFFQWLDSNDIDCFKPIFLMGHNVRSFDAFFLKDMFDRHSLRLQFAARTFDSAALCLLHDVDDSTELFKKLGIVRGNNHDALEDVRATAEAFRRTKKVIHEKSSVSSLL